MADLSSSSMTPSLRLISSYFLSASCHIVLASLSCLPCTQLYKYFPVRVLPHGLGLSFLSSLYTIPLLPVRVLPHRLGLSCLTSLYTATQLIPVFVLPHGLGLSFLSSLYTVTHFLPVCVLPHGLGLSFLSSLYTVTQLILLILVIGLPFILGSSCLPCTQLLLKLLPFRVLPHHLDIFFLLFLYTGTLLNCAFFPAPDLYSVHSYSVTSCS